MHILTKFGPILMQLPPLPPPQFTPLIYSNPHLQIILRWRWRYEGYPHQTVVTLRDTILGHSTFGRVDVNVMHEYEAN